jgi:hypothetical protein
MAALLLKSEKDLRAWALSLKFLFLSYISGTKSSSKNAVAGVNRTTKMMSGNAPEPKKRDAAVTTTPK